MKKIQKNLVNKESGFLITSKELLAEIEPLMQDFFNGKILFEGDDLIYKTPNGQVFVISAKVC